MSLVGFLNWLYLQATLVIEFFGLLYNKARTVLVDWWGKQAELYGWLWNRVRSLAVDWYSRIDKTVNDWWNKISTIVNDWWGRLAELMGWLWGRVREVLVDWWGRINQVVNDWWTRIAWWFNEGWSKWSLLLIEPWRWPEFLLELIIGEREKVRASVQRGCERVLRLFWEGEV